MMGNLIVTLVSVTTKIKANCVNVFLEKSLSNHSKKSFSITKSFRDQCSFFASLAVWPDFASIVFAPVWRMTQNFAKIEEASIAQRICLQLTSWVRIPCTPSTLFPLLVRFSVLRKGQKINRKSPLLKQICTFLLLVNNCYSIIYKSKVKLL